MPPGPGVLSFNAACSDEYNSTRIHRSGNGAMLEITPTELKEYLATADSPPLLLDVREPSEYAICHIAGSRHIPMNLVPQAHAELDPEQEIVVICHHGMRSARVATYLQQIGFNKVLNLAGGIHAWAREVDANMPTY